MKTTESIGKLSEALAKAQAEMTPIEKDEYNEYFDSEFASFHSSIVSTRTALTKHGLAVIQDSGGDGTLLTISTRLAHSSGEWIESSISIPYPKGNRLVQELGSAISYLRRYSYMAIVCAVVEGDVEDDDGETAVGRGKAEPEPEVELTPWDHGTQKQFFKNFKKIADGLTYDELKDWCANHNRDKPSLMDDETRGKLLDWLESDGVKTVQNWLKEQGEE